MNPNTENILSREIIHHSQELAYQAYLTYGDQYPLSLLGFYQGDTMFSIYEANPSLSSKKLSRYALKRIGLTQPDWGTRALLAVDYPNDRLLVQAHNDTTKPPSSYVIDLCRPASPDKYIDSDERKNIIEDITYRFMETSINNITYGSSEMAQHGEPLLPVVEKDSIYDSTANCARQIFEREPNIGESLRVVYELADRSTYTMSYEINLVESNIAKAGYIQEPKIRLTFTELPRDNDTIPRSVAMNITKRLNEVNIKSFIYDQDLSIPIVNISDPGSIRELNAVTSRLALSLSYSLGASKPINTGLTKSIARPAGVEFSVEEFIERQLNAC